MSRYLKLVGSETYNSRSTGLIRRDQIVEIEDDELADRLLEKGTQVDEEFLKPTFREVSQPASLRRKPAKPRQLQRTEPEQDDGGADLSVSDLDPTRKPQAPHGLGENGAESTRDLNEADTEQDGAKDQAYHDDQEEEQEENDESSNDDAESDKDESEDAPATAAKAAPKPAATRVRAKKS